MQETPDVMYFRALAEALEQGNSKLEAGMIAKAHVVGFARGYVKSRGYPVNVLRNVMEYVNCDVWKAMDILEVPHELRTLVFIAVTEQYKP